VLFAVFSLACWGAPPREDSQLRRDWLDKDAERARAVVRFLESGEPTVERLREELGSYDLREDRALGFGARRVRLAAYGGYTTIWITAYAATPRSGSSALASLRIEQEGSDEAWPGVAAALAPIWGDAATRVEHGLRVERRYDDVDQRLRQRREAALGAADGKPSSEHAAAFELLTSPLAELIVGRSFGDDGAPPPGFEAAEQLARNGQTALLRATLRGPNLEGRVYAAHALLARSAADERDRATIDALAKVQTPIQTSEGCELTARGWSDALALLGSR